MGAPSAKEDILRFESYELDLKNRELRRSGILIALQPQAFRILALLASRPGQTVTRKEITSELWPEDSFGDLDNRLNFEIKKIRESLRDDAERPRYIETVRKTGYKFVAPAEHVRSDELESPDRQGPLQEGVQDRALPPVEPHREGSLKLPARSLTPAWRHMLAGAVLGAAVVAPLWIASAELHRVPRVLPEERTVDAISRTPFLKPVINEVSPILPTRFQDITIEGSGFGHYTSFHDLDTPFLAIGDETRHWSAGRITPDNPDEVTLTVSTWTDTDIVIERLSGRYGERGWVLEPGDNIKIRVWNPQTGAGPAEFYVNVIKPPASVPRDKP